MRSSEEQGFHHEANRQTFRGGVGQLRSGFADRMGRLRKELAIGLGIGKPMLLDGDDNDDDDNDDDNNDDTK